MSNSREINLAKEVAYAHDIIDMKIHVLAPYNLSYYAVDGSTLQQTEQDYSVNIQRWEGLEG